MTDKLLVLTTAGSEQEADKIAHALVERRLAACVNIVPRIQSVYRWDGKVESAEEFLLIIKTTRNREEGVRSAIQEKHLYKLPECIAIAIEAGSEKYLQWIEDSVSWNRRARNVTKSKKRQRELSAAVRDALPQGRAENLPLVVAADVAPVAANVAPIMTHIVPVGPQITFIVSDVTPLLACARVVAIFHISSNLAAVLPNVPLVASDISPVLPPVNSVRPQVAPVLAHVSVLS
jgi:periplasmic divalent cation tolerance protein